MQELRRLCPAKVNLYLKVRGRRPDGYHELLTVLQPLTLADELYLRPAGTLELTCDHPEVPSDARNLIWQAARRFAVHTGLELRVCLRLVKRIPVAAGLGGGSSDAAATLLLLNEWAGHPLDAAALHHLASGLGADVPFFLHGGPAVGRGIGSELSPIDLPPYWYVLLNPGISVSTAWVYRQWDLKASAARGIPARESWDGAQPEKWVGNDLESVTLEHYPGLRPWLDRLAHQGAVARGMSGSGPTLFGLFWDKETALAAARQLRREFPGWLAVTRGLTLNEGPCGWEGQVWII